MDLLSRSSSSIPMMLLTNSAPLQLMTKQALKARNIPARIPFMYSWRPVLTKPVE